MISIVTELGLIGIIHLKGSAEACGKLATGIDFVESG